MKGCAAHNTDSLYEKVFWNSKRGFMNSTPTFTVLWDDPASQTLLLWFLKAADFVPAGMQRQSRQIIGYRNKKKKQYTDI